MKQVQIPQKLFVQLIHYHLMEDDNHEGEIRIGLEKKLDALVLRELYGKSKTALTEEEREKGGYRTVSAGKVFFDDIRQERVTLL